VSKTHSLSAQLLSFDWYEIDRIIPYHAASVYTILCSISSFRISHIITCAPHLKKSYWTVWSEILRINRSSCETTQAIKLPDATGNPIPSHRTAALFHLISLHFILFYPVTSYPLSLVVFHPITFHHTHQIVSHLSSRILVPLEDHDEP
jgi:hypothetical protein